MGSNDKSCEEDDACASTRVGETESSSVVPTVGMVFNSEDAAYDFYNEHAKRLGFSIKKLYLERRKDGSLKYRTFSCSKQGLKKTHPTHETKKPQAGTRTNCMARVDFKISINNVWTISKVQINHNHPMTSPNKVNQLRSHRKILPFQRSLIDQMTASGMKAHNIHNYFQSGAGNMDVGFIRDDTTNYIQKQRQRRLDGLEKKGILNYLTERRAKDPSFFSAIEVQSSGEIANFFWADGRSIVDYAYFGDVISFDTTFQTNDYDMPFAPIVGVNQHKQTIIFGAALLYDETAESFIWLFETFLKVMSGRHPMTIFTDQSAAISKAIEIVMPNTAHRLCLWHLFNNAVTHLSHEIHSSAGFIEDLRHVVYERCSIDRFEVLWTTLVNKYQLSENNWIQNFYKIRTKWAACYRAQTFCAGISTSQRSESINGHFKHFFKKKLSLFEFVEQYDKAVTFFREKELKEDFRSRNSTPVNAFCNMLREAASVYSIVMYREFEEEFKMSFDSSITFMPADSDDGCLTFKVILQKNGRDEFVMYNPSSVTVNCTCKLYELNGILCGHCIKVLAMNNVNSIPQHYILNRWTKYARQGHGYHIGSPIREGHGKESLTSMYNRVCQKQFCMSTKSIHSRKALEMIEVATNQLSIQVDELLRTEPIIIDSQFESNEISEADIIEEPIITIKPPIAKKGPKEKRKKGLLERIKKNKKTTSGSSSLPLSNLNPVPAFNPTSMYANTQVPQPSTMYTPSNLNTAMPVSIFSCVQLNAQSYTHNDPPPVFSYSQMMMENTSTYISDEASQVAQPQLSSQENEPSTW